MAERKLKGSDDLFFIDPDGGTNWALVVCLTTQTIGVVNNIIDAATKCGADKQPGKQEFNCSFEGQIMLETTDGRISADVLWELAAARTEFSWKYGVVSPTTGDVVKTGRAFLADYKESSDIDNPATFSCTLGIVGTPTQTRTGS